MPQAPPFFSVIIPTHKRPEVLKRALLSLRRQSFQDFESIVVADVLEAGTAQVCAELLREADVFVKRSGKPGPAESRNLGLLLAKGRGVVCLDDDDPFLEGHLAGAHQRITQARQEGAAQAEVLFSDYEVTTENRAENPEVALSRFKILLKDRKVMDLFVKNFIPNNVLLFQRQILEGCSTDPHLESLEDWDFLLSVCARAMPVYYEGGGAVVHKDYEHPDQGRGSRPEAYDSNVVLDVLHVYRRWRAPSPEVQAQRQAQILTVGLNLPLAIY